MFFAKINSTYSRVSHTKYEYLLDIISNFVFKTLDSLFLTVCDFFYLYIISDVDDVVFLGAWESVIHGIV